MANHGYIQRDGKNVGLTDLVKGLKACYGLSTFLAYFLALGGFIILKKFGKLNLFEIGKHGAVEHNASLVHLDTPEGEKYAPIEIQPDLVDALINDVKPQKPTGVGAQDGLSGVVMNDVDVGRARVRREKECKPVDAIHAEIARGEMAIILGVWETQSGDKKGVPVEWIREWIGHERLPKGWKPTRVQGFFDVVKRSKGIRMAADAIRKQEAQEKASATDEKAKL
ncbi:hypothetical protein AX16_003331 [Volvariella volvacea WC 439]|nr:hypothetical protein AX16_003331 [Volvariella volvacea WC 439]